MLNSYTQRVYTLTCAKNTARNVFLLILLGDIAFMIVHVLHVAQLGVFSWWRFSIASDRGFAANFLYLQEFAVLVVALVLFVYYRHALIFATLAAMFGYIFSDDAFMLHEHLGLGIAQALQLPAFGSMRPRDIGELVVFGVFGLIFSGLFLYIYFVSKGPDRRSARILLGLLLFLASCGVGFDALHMAFEQPWLAGPLGLMEDGGEMLAVSAFLYYILRLFRTEVMREPQPALVLSSATRHL